jgi:hypothetical protein
VRTRTRDEIAAALKANAKTPYGLVRTARAERLVQLADGCGDRSLVVRALLDVVEAHNWDGTGERMLVPFARLLRMWDDHPDDFDRHAVYRLHWQFKWVTGDLLGLPGVPLAAIQRWLAEMATRYRQAGYGMRAVYKARFSVAWHIGDMDAAQRAFDDWMAADRDEMSDCRACETNRVGDWYDDLGRDAEALAAWQPILTGELDCLQEPHRVLADSLLPLVRLGRLDEARANHLRGYGMVRGDPGLRRVVGGHIEFAALTGSEARGLEILAEHATWLGPDRANGDDRSSFLKGVAILLRRLVVLGRADLPVATPAGRAPATPVGELLAIVEAKVVDTARRFDERNRTTAVGDRTRARLAQQPLAAVPLDV